MDCLDGASEALPRPDFEFFFSDPQQQDMIAYANFEQRRQATTTAKSNLVLLRRYFRW